jgi:hypothetical protein
MRFVGNVEGRDVGRGVADVLVTDGFTGNVVLKTAEGVAREILGMVRSAMTGDLVSKLAAGVLRPRLVGVRDRVDPENYGGSYLLGVRGPVVIGHGNSRARGVENAIVGISRTGAGLGQPWKARWLPSTPARRRGHRDRSSCGQIVGVGRALGSRVVTNGDLEGVLDTTDEWISSRTGIKERRFVDEGENCATLAIEASKQGARTRGGRGRVRRARHLRHVDGARVHAFGGMLDRGGDRGSRHRRDGPGSGVRRLLVRGHRGRLHAAKRCGWQGLARRRGRHEHHRRPERSLHGGALRRRRRRRILDAGDGESGFVDHILGADGRGAPLGRAGHPGDDHKLYQNGREVFKFAVRILPEMVEKLLSRNGVSPDEVQYVIPHQANARIIKAAAKKLEVPEERVVINLDRFGNTSAASIPLSYPDIYDSLEPAATSSPSASGSGSPGPRTCTGSRRAGEGDEAGGGLPRTGLRRG